MLCLFLIYVCWLGVARFALKIAINSKCAFLILRKVIDILISLFARWKNFH